MLTSLDPLHTCDSLKPVCSAYSDEARQTDREVNMEDSLSMGLSGRIPVHTEVDKPSNLSTGTESVLSFYPMTTAIPNLTRCL